MTNFYATPTGAGTKSGASWANALAAAELFSVLVNDLLPDDTVWVAEGTYTLTGNIESLLEGTNTAPINIIGVASGTTNEPPVTADYAVRGNFPVFSGGSYYVELDSYIIVKNIEFTASLNDYTVNSIYRCVFNNCTIENLGSGLSCVGLDPATSTLIINTRLSAPNGTCVDGSGDNIRLLYCHVTGGTAGFACSSDGCLIDSCIFSACGIGIELGSTISTIIKHNTIYNCTTGISDAGNSTLYPVIYNNTLSALTTGIALTGIRYPAFIDYNNYYANTTDVSGITKGPNALAVNPHFTDASSDNYSLSSESGLIGAGLSMQLGIGE